MLARAYQLLKRPEDARRYLERARNRAPHDSNVLRAVAAFYRESGRFDEAISSLKEVSDKSAEYWGEFGYTYQVAGKENEAAEAYVHAANQDKNEINYQLSAALALLNAGKVNDAKTFIQRGDVISPNHYRLHAIRGQLASMENRTDDAIKEYRGGDCEPSGRRSCRKACCTRSSCISIWPSSIDPLKIKTQPASRSRSRLHNYKKSKLPAADVRNTCACGRQLNRRKRISGRRERSKRSFGA